MEIDLKQTFSRNLKAKVIEMNLTVKDGAKLMGVSRETFKSWVYGRRFPRNPEHLKKVIDVFNFDDLYLLIAKECA
jgi:transcriptional regulator with XRE-family HTH domain